MIESSYVAGLFDGEGCVLFPKLSSRKGIPNGRISLYISITNKNKEVLDEVQKKFKGTVFRNQQGIYRWATSANRASKFLKEIFPWLIIKREEALLGILFRVYRGYFKQTRRGTSIKRGNHKSKLQINTEERLRKLLFKCPGRRGNSY